MNLSKDEASDEDDDESLDHEPRNHGLEKNQKKKIVAWFAFPDYFGNFFPNRASDSFCQMGRYGFLPTTFSRDSNPHQIYRPETLWRMLYQLTYHTAASIFRPSSSPQFKLIRLDKKKWMWWQDLNQGRLVEEDQRYWIAQLTSSAKKTDY